MSPVVIVLMPFFNRTIILVISLGPCPSSLKFLALPTGSDMGYITWVGPYIQTVIGFFHNVSTSMPYRQVSIVDHTVGCWADHCLSLLITCRDLPALWKLTSSDETSKSLSAWILSVLQVKYVVTYRTYHQVVGVTNSISNNLLCLGTYGTSLASSFKRSNLILALSLDL